jgi:uncharacterized membrane protein YfcA
MNGSSSNRNVPLFACAVALAVIGIGCLIFLRGRFLFHTAGLLAILIAVYLVRKSNFHEADRLANENKTTSIFQKLKSLGVVVWAIALALVVAFVLAYFALQVDAANGGHDVVPVYVFFGLTWATVIYLAYVFYRFR